MMPQPELPFLKDTFYAFNGIILMSALSVFVENSALRNKNKNNNLVILKCKVTRKLKRFKILSSLLN